MKQLYFVRHGQTEWNAVRRMQGQFNSDLTELGQQQAHTNGQFLADVSIDYLVASPLDRTRQTAAIINLYLQLDIKYDARIMEWDCGDWSGELWDQLDKKWPVEFNAWRSDPFNFRGPKCENYPDMIDRVTPFLQELLGRPETSIAIVSHGVIGRVMVGYLLDMNADEMLSFSQNNDAIMQLSGLANYNYCHFIGGKGPIAGLPPRSI